MVTRLQQLGDVRLGGQAGGEGQGVVRLLQGGQRLLQRVTRWVAAAAVFEALEMEILVE